MRDPMADNHHMPQTPEPLTAFHVLIAVIVGAAFGIIAVIAILNLSN